MSPECHRPQRSPRLCGGPERGARIRRHFGVTAVGIICACALSSGDFVSRNFSPGYPSTHAPWFIGMRVSPPWCLSHWGPGLPWLGGGTLCTGAGSLAFTRSMPGAARPPS